jgi:hypothetical protein
MQSLRKEENASDRLNNINTLNDLKDELDFIVSERTKLSQKVVKLTDELERSNEKTKTTLAGGGLGFGGAAAGSLYYCLPPEWMAVSLAVGTLAGMCIGDAIKKCPEKSNG